MQPALIYLGLLLLYLLFLAPQSSTPSAYVEVEVQMWYLPLPWGPENSARRARS